MRRTRALVDDSRAMFVAASRIVLDFYGNDDLAVKHVEIEKLIKALRAKHPNLSAAEVEDFDDFERCVIGLALVAASEKSARAAIDRCVEFVEENSFARVTADETEVTRF